MSDWTSLSVKRSTRERFNELKAETADEHNPDMSANEFLHGLMDTLEDVRDGKYENNGEDTNDVAEKLDRIEERMKDFSVTENQQRVINKIEDHETEMKKFFERELGR